MAASLPNGLVTALPSLVPKTSLATTIPMAHIHGAAGDVLSSAAGALTVRGGAFAAAAADAAASSFDLTRARIRLEGLSAYGVTAALLMNGALRLLSSMPKRMTDEQHCEKHGMNRRVAMAARAENAANAAIAASAASCAVCILAAAYTTIVFSMLALYSKTALGMGFDDKYVEFFSATAPYRRHGFQTYAVSLVCFMTAMVLNLLLTYKGWVRWAVGGIAAAMSLATWLHLSQIMGLASILLYH